jgi:serine/threonine-protein kinase
VSASLPKHGRRDGITSRRVGRYDVTSVLGQGAMGVVYRAHDPLLDRHVAIKVMAAALASEPAVRARFEREAQAAARLAHPNVVTVYDFGYQDGAPFVVMELLRGQDLRTALRNGADMPLERRLSIVWQVLAGLGHAHGAGVVHRDVKPANVFLTDAGGVKVLDFGMARVTWAGSAGSGGVVGTFDYMSPEQVESRRADGRSDVFSVGSVLFELLCGHPPFQADSMVSTAYRIVHGDPDFGALPKGDAFEALEPVLRKALAKEPGDRYASAREFAADLAERGGAPWRAWPAETVPEAPAENAIGFEPAASTASAPRALSPRRIWAAAIVLTAAGLVAYTALRPAPVSAPAETTAAPAPLEPAATTAPSPRPLARAVPPARSEAAPSPTPEPEGAASVAAEAPSVEELPAPVSGRVAPLSVVVGAAAPGATRGRWTGYITDESCRHRGGVSGHWSCAQVCLRKGFRPLLDVDGTLYRIDGLERVRGNRERMVTVEGTLDPITATIHVD